MSDKGSLFKTGIPKEQVSYGTYWIEEMGSGGYDHPTIKPLKPHSDQIQICTNVGDLIADPFSGSGTTIIAAENLSRQCRAVEMSPAYVAVALERCAAMGLEPYLSEPV
jgi:DNA modification methylase